MFTYKHIQQIIDCIKKLGITNKFEEYMTASKALVLTEIDADSNEKIDIGLDSTLLNFSLEILIPELITKSINSDASYLELLTSFCPFLGWFAVELIKQHQAIESLKQVQSKYGNIAADENLRQWQRELKSVSSLLLDFIQISRNKEIKAKEVSVLAEQFSAQVKTFKLASENLKKIPDDYLDKMTEVVIESSSNLSHTSFTLLNKENNGTINIPVSNSTLLSEKDMATTSRSNETKNTLQPDNQAKLVENFLNNNSSKIPAKLSASKLEQLFEASRYQQFVLLGHNALLSCARPEKYESLQKKYIDNLSAVILSQQIMLSHKYIEVAAEEKLNDSNNALPLEISPASIEQKPSIENILSTALAEITNGVSDDLSPLDTKSFINQLSNKVSTEVAKVSPHLASLLISLDQRKDIPFANQFGQLISEQLPGVIEKIDNGLLKKLVDQIGGVEKLQTALNDITNNEWAKNLDKSLNQGVNTVKDLLDGFNIKINDMGGGELLNKAKDIIEGFSKEGVEGALKQVFGGSGNGTLLDFGGPILGAAVGQFLPVLTREVFGDNDFGNAATGAISAAITGFTAGGPVGALVGAGISIFSSIFSGNDENKAAELQAMEDRLQNKMNAVSNDIKAYTGACVEKLDQRMMRKFNDLQDMLKQISGDLHENIDALGRHIDEEFVAVFDGIDKLSRDMEINAVQLHRHIDHLARFNAERFDHLEGTMIHVGKSLYKGMQAIHLSQQNQLDRMEANLMRAIVNVNYTVEQQFIQQKTLLLKLRSIQKQEHAETQADLADIKNQLDVIERIARSQREAAIEHFKQVEQKLDQDTVWKPLLNARSYALAYDPMNEKVKTKKHLINLSILAETIYKSSYMLDEKIYLLNILSQVYLSLFYRTYPLWKDDLIQKATIKVVNLAINLYKSAVNLPLLLLKNINIYQRVFYELYQDMMIEYLEALDTYKTISTTKKVALPVEEEFDEEDEKNKTISGAKKFTAWDGYKDSDNSFNDIGYGLKSYSARLDNRAKITGKILDVIIKEDKTIYFFTQENNQIFARRFNLGKAVDKALEAGKEGNKLINYPIVLANYREVSAVELNAELRSYKEFVDSCGKFATTLSFSNQSYVMRYCYDYQSIEAKIRLWHPQNVTSEILLPSAMRPVKFFNALVRRGQLIGLLVDESNNIWIGTWDIKTGQAKLPCSVFNGLNFVLDSINKNTSVILREWHGWLVIADRYLIDPENLVIKTNPQLAHLVFYDSDQSYVRLFAAGNKHEQTNGVLFNYEKQAFESASSLSTKNGGLNHNYWEFNDNKLQLAWPAALIGLQDISLREQKYIGKQGFYSIYYTNAGQILLLRDYEQAAQQNLTELHLENDNKVWEDYKKKMYPEWIAPLDGALPSDSGPKEDRYKSLRGLKELVVSLKNDLHIYFQTEFAQKPGLENYITTALSGFEKLLKFNQFASNKDFIFAMQEIIRATAYLQQQLYISLTKQDLVNTHFPQLLQILDAFKKATTFINNASIFDCQLKSAPLTALTNTYIQATAMGFEFTLSTQAKNAYTTSLALEVKVFGKSWKDFLTTDRLFLERFRETSQYEQVLSQFLSQLEVWLIKYGYSNQNPSQLAEEFFTSANDKLNLVIGNPAEIEKCCQEWSELFKIEVKTQESRKQASQPAKLLYTPGQSYFFNTAISEAKKAKVEPEVTNMDIDDMSSKNYFAHIK